jgi:inner membrane protein
MTGRSHIIASGIVGAALSMKFDLHPAHIFISIAGGLFPDTDMKKSYLGRFIPLWILFKPHRKNMTHSLFGAVLFSLPWLLPSYILLFLAGYLSHLFLDLFNKRGIPLWWPRKHCVTIADIRVGGTGELLVIFVFYMIVIAILSYL